ncbi:MAG: hypothetical protein RIC93_09685, partial [Alphaproteobacteria bacterium]
MAEVMSDAPGKRSGSVAFVGKPAAKLCQEIRTDPAVAGRSAASADFGALETKIEQILSVKYDLYT